MTDDEILHQLKLRHIKPMPHGTTELLCLKAAELIERLHAELEECKINRDAFAENSRHMG